MKPAVNIQVNGTVNGGIHVYGRGAPLAGPAPELGHRTGQGSDALWIVVKVLGAVVLGAFALVGGLALAVTLLAIVLGVVAVALAWWLLCRAANVVLFTERLLGGAPTRLVLVPGVVRGVHALATGDRVDDRIRELGDRRSDYVDAE